MNGIIPKEVLLRAQENSAYLRESLSLFPDLATALQQHPAQNLLTQLYQNIPADIGSHAEEMAQLRTLKRRAHLLIALQDIAQIWDWDAVTKALTELADFCMHRLLIAGARELSIGGADEDNPVPGLFVLAMGKYGAGELNYSSDIDFCVFYDAEVIDLPRPERAQRDLIKFVQKLAAGFERVTAEGYIFRADLRLRPDPRSNAVAVSTATAERYYETLGQNWERAAMIKARVCGGDAAVGAQFIKNVLRPFIWRRSLDYAAIEDIHSIKRQVQARQNSTKILAAGHHIKLGLGGIREVEFYAQTQQLILGGRDVNVRTPRTVEALRALADGNYIEPNEAQILSQHYALLRRFEHAAQMREDAQTHIAPVDEEARLELAKLSGYDSLAEFDTALVATISDVHKRYSALFPEHESLGLPEGNLSFTGVEAGPATLATLRALGFEHGPRLWRDMADWLGGRVAATRTERARELLTRLAPRLIKICAQTSRPDAAFVAFASFFERVNGGVSLLSMFLQQPARLAQIIDLMLISPRLSDTLSGRPAILDGMIAPNFMTIERARLGQDYHGALTGSDDFEGAMNYVRRRVREDQFRISASVLSGNTPLDRAALMLSKVANETVAVMLPVAARETERTIGVLPGEYAVLALGKAGGEELSLASDLDVMVIYKTEAAGKSSGAGADVGAAQAFAKLTQRLISALSATTAEGRLFEVDMALRPSGRAGPVAVSLAAFKRYYAERAWTWEFMALSRARVMAISSPAFAAELEAALKDALCAPRADLDMPADIAGMLRRVRSEKPSRGAWDVKQAHGGLRDIEFIAQSLYLARRGDYAGRGICSTQGMIEHAHGLGQIDDSAQDLLLCALRHYQDISQGLTFTHGSLKGAVEHEVIEAVARLMKADDGTALTHETQNHMARIMAIVPNYIN